MDGITSGPLINHVLFAVIHLSEDVDPESSLGTVEEEPLKIQYVCGVVDRMADALIGASVVVGVEGDATYLKEGDDAEPPPRIENEASSLRTS